MIDLEASAKSLPEMGFFFISRDFAGCDDNF